MTGEWEWVGAAFVALAAVIGSWLTRRSSRDVNAVTGLTELINQLRIERADDRERIGALEKKERRRLELAQAHRRWDRMIQRKIEGLTDEVIPDPPPLED